MFDKKLFLLGALFLMVQVHCNDNSVNNRGPLYGIQKISVGQHSIYFKREIRGRNYDGFSISSDSNLCNGPSPKTDFFVNSETVGKVYYKVKDDELLIYSQSVFTPPSTGSFPVKIIQRKIPLIEFSEEDAIGLGYTEVLLPIQSLKNCEY